MKKVKFITIIIYNLAKEVKTKAEAIRAMYQKNILPFFGELNF